MAQEARLVITIDSREAERRTQALERELSSIQRTGDFATRSTDRLSVATRQLAGYMAGLVTIGAAVSKMDAYTGLQNRLKLVTTSQTELNQAMKDTFKIAQSTGQAWESTAQVYQRFADNAKRLGISLQQTASLTDTVAKAIAISGGSAASAEAALVQFGQALASGVLRGEEFNSISEQAPGLLKAIATGLDTNIGQLRAMAAEGKLTGDVVIKSLEKAKASVDELFGKTDFTIGNSFTMLNNAVIQFVGEAGKGNGAAQAISSSLKGLADNLELVANAATLGGVAFLTKTIISQTSATKAAVGASIERRATLIAEIEAQAAVTASEVRRTGAIAELRAMQLAEAQATAARMTGMQRLAYVQSTIIPLEVRATAATAAHTAAVEADTVVQELNNKARSHGAMLLGALGGPIGAITLGVTALAAGYMLLSDKTDEATLALDGQKTTVLELTEAYQKMSLAKLIAEIDTLKSKSISAQEEMNKALVSLQSVAPSLGNYSTPEQNRRADELSKIIKDLRNDAIDTDSALKLMGKAGFTEGQITKASKYFLEFDKNKDVLTTVNNQLNLAKTYSTVASDAYEKTATKIANLTKESGRLDNKLENANLSFKNNAEILLQIGANSGASADQIKSVTDAIAVYNKESKDAGKLAQVFNSNLPIPKEAIDSFIKQAGKIDENKSALAKVNAELKNQNSLRDGYLKQHQSVLSAQQEVTKGLNEQITAQQKLNALEKLKEQRTEAKYILMTAKNLNGDIEKAKALLEYRKLLGMGATGGQIPIEQRKWFEDTYKATIELKNYEDKITQAKREQTKELEKQSKLSQRLIGISGNTGIGTGAHLDVRYGGSRDGQKVSKEHLARLQAGGKSLSSYKVSSDYGQRKAPTAGASSFHKGIDFAMPVGTPITTTVAVKDVKTAYDAKGGGYYSTVTFEDGVVLKLLHQAPSVMSKIKGGPSDGTYKSTLDLEKQADEVARNQIQLQMAVADEITRIRQNLADDLKEIDKAGYSDEEAIKLKAQYQVQANNDIAIAQQTIRIKLDDYKAFTKTEEQLLRDSFARRQFEALHDLELTKSQRHEAVKLLSQQEQQELALIKLSQEQRLYQSKLFLLSESEAIRERYRLERKEIEQTVKDEEELRKRLALSREQEQQEQLTKAAQASKNWGSTYAEIMGNSQMFQLDQTRKDRTGQSLAIADSQNADVMSRAQDPNADMEALAAEQEAIWQAHRDRMALIDQDYWNKTKAYQLGMAADVFGGLSGVMLNFVDESSSSYRLMIAAQKGANLASVFMSNIAAISAAWSSAPFPANLPAVALTTAKTGVLQATLQAFTPQGFATGGQIIGPGTGTSDSIPIMASNKEFMFKASSAASIGLDNLNYMNRTGELPQNHDATQLSAIQRQQLQSDLINTSINQRNAGVAQTMAPTIVDNQMVVNNVFNPKDIPDAMANPYGAKVFMNFIKLHKSTIRGMLGVT